MLDVSSEYRIAMREQFREPTDIEILWNFVDEEAADDMIAITNGESFPSEAQKISRYNKYYHYASCENKGFRLGAGQLVMPRNKADILYQGFESYVLSNENSLFQEQPYIDMTFTELHRTRGLILEFDPLLNRHPKKIRIQSWVDSNVITDKIYEVDNYRYKVDTDFYNFNRIKIIWIENTEPFQRARLSSIIFGVEVLFTKDMIELSSGVIQSEEIDPIMRRHSIRKLGFTFINEDKAYDFDNPEGVWRYIDTKTTMGVTYKQNIIVPIATTLDAELDMPFDSVEIRQEHLNGGKYVLNSMPSVDGIKVNINATSRIETLNEIYYKSGNYLQGRTLYDLAIDVLTDAKRIPDEYFLSEKLKDYITTGFLPHIEHKNCLKLIAEAAMCILYEDRNGIIRIEPNNKVQAIQKISISTNVLDAQLDFSFDEIIEIETDFSMDFWDIKNIPKGGSSPQLWFISATTYNYSIETEISELAKADLIVSSEIQRIVFANAENVEYNGSAVINNIFIYGGIMFYKCISSGNIILTGNKIIKSENKKDFIYDNKGIAEKIENQLITNDEQIEKVAQWKSDWLKNRDTYSYAHYGDPSIEANDLFPIETDFSNNIPTRILISNTIYRGALSGSITAKRVD